MKTFLLASLFALGSLAGGPEPAQDSPLQDPQLKIDLMFTVPEQQPFSLEVLYGSPEVLAVLKAPEHIEVFRIDPDVPGEYAPGTRTILGHAVLSGPVVPSASVGATLVDLFAAKDTFCDRPMCGRQPGVLVRATARGKAVDLLFCFKCHDVVVARNDKQATLFTPNLEAVQIGMPPKTEQRFLHVFQTLFPTDEALRSVKSE